MTIEMQGAPDGVMTVSVTGFVDADRQQLTETRALGSDGGHISLSDGAVLNVPPDALQSTSPISIELSTVDSPFMDYLAELDGHVNFLAVPKYRIKSDAPFRQPVRLLVPVPRLATILPAGTTAAVVAISRQFGVVGEDITSLQGTGGDICSDGAAVCVSLPPEMFVQENPADPNDPVVQIGVVAVPIASADLRLWQVLPGSVRPTHETISVTPSQGLAIAIEFELQPNFSVFGATPLATPVRIRQPFGALRRGGLWYHQGVDLLADVGTPVFNAIGTRNDQSVIPSAVERADRRDVHGYGRQVLVVHGSSGIVKTRYAHLSAYDVNPGNSVDGTTKIGTTGIDGNAANTEPHLHFELLFDGHAIDPVPLLPGHLVDEYFADQDDQPRFYVRLDYRTVGGDPVPLSSTQQMVSASISAADLATVPPGRHTLMFELCSGKLGCHLVQRWTVDLRRPLLTISKAGSGKGTVTSVPSGIQCDPDCPVQTVEVEGDVLLTPTAAPGSTFVGWSGGGCSGSGPCAVTVDSDTSVVAKFDTAQTRFPLQLDGCSSPCVIPYEGADLVIAYAGPWSSNGGFSSAIQITWCVPGSIRSPDFWSFGCAVPDAASTPFSIHPVFSPGPYLMNCVNRRYLSCQYEYGVVIVHAFFSTDTAVLPSVLSVQEP